MNKRIFDFLTILISSTLLVIIAGIFFFWHQKHSLPIAANSEIIETVHSASFDENFNITKHTASGRFYPFWINYRTADGWDKIDTTLTQTPNGFQMLKAPFEFTAPLTAGGVALFHNNNRWDNVAMKQIAAPPLDLTIQPLNVDNVPGKIEQGTINNSPAQFVIYPKAYNSLEADLIYFIGYGKAPQLEKLIRFNTDPNLSQDAVISFDYSYSENVNFTQKVGGINQNWDKQTILKTINKSIDVAAISTKEKRGIGFKTFYIWDSNPNKRKMQAVEVDFSEEDNNHYLLSKIIPASFFKDAVYPVYTDATNIFYPNDTDHGNLIDGRQQYSSSATWSTARDATTATFSDATETSGRAPVTGKTGGNYYFNRAFFNFQTGDGVGSGDTISDASLVVYLSTPLDPCNDAYDFLTLGEFKPASYSSLATTDFEKITDMNGTNPHGAGKEYKDLSDYASSTGSYLDITNITNGAFLEIAVNATGTPLIGRGAGTATGFAIVEGHDATNKLSAASGCFGADSDDEVVPTYTEGSNKPFLKITFASTTVAAVAQPAQSNWIFQEF